MTAPHPALRRGIVAAAAATSLWLTGTEAPQIVMPTTLDAPERRAAPVEADPTGTAAMAFTYGTQTEVETSIAPLLLAAAEDTYRRVRTAERRSASSDQGAPAPMLLSPDGRTLAVGASRDNGTVALLDLSSGETAEVSLGVNATLPSAWDPGNGFLWVRGRHVYEAQRSGSTTRDDWEWHRIDLDGRRAERLPALAKALNVAPLHGTDQLLVRHNRAQAQLFSVTDLEPVGDSFDLTGSVEGWASSPDGRRFAVAGHDELRIHDAAEPQDVAASVEIPEGARFHGWVDDSSVLVGWNEETTGRWVLDEVDLGSGERKPVTEQPAARSGATVSAVSLATGLLAELGTRDPGASDHGALWSRLGPWRFVLIALGALLVSALALVVRRRRRR